MRPVELPAAQIVRFLEVHNPGRYELHLIGGPHEGGDGIIPCPTVVQRDVPGFAVVCHVAWQLDEIELVHLARGGTLWLTTFTGLPVHAMTVLPPDGAES